MIGRDFVQLVNEIRFRSKSINKMNPSLKYEGFILNQLIFIIVHGSGGMCSACLELRNVTANSERKATATNDVRRIFFTV